MRQLQLRFCFWRVTKKRNGKAHISFAPPSHRDKKLPKRPSDFEWLCFPASGSVPLRTPGWLESLERQLATNLLFVLLCIGITLVIVASWRTILLLYYDASSTMKFISLAVSTAVLLPSAHSFSSIGTSLCCCCTWCIAVHVLCSTFAMWCRV